MKDPLLSWRKEFPILQSKTYFISNSLGAMPRAVLRRLQEYAETWSTKGVKAWADEWWDMPIRVGDSIAPLIGAGNGEVSMHPNITTMESIILSCFEPKGKRNKIVCEELNFPSVLYLYRKWAKRHRCRLHLVKSQDGIRVDLVKFLRAIDETTLLVPISHVLFKSAFIQDAKTIIQKAHKVGAKVVLDAYQSVGIIPVDVEELGVDVLVGGVLKWLCGGPGGAFLYVRPDLAKKLKPSFTGWLAHKRPFDFDTGNIEYNEDASRFLNGTPAIPALYAAESGPKIIREVGIQNIREKSLRQTDLLIKLADNAGLSVMSPREPECRGGTVTISVPHAYEVSQELIARGILVDYRKGAGIRIAPHFYNSDEEIRLAIEQMRDIHETKAYEKQKRRKSIVT
ncbi:MAG: aminotransferase class V-fold PLP-dependent enzyme [Ignavibacteriales bacterium]|nr:aminotransferase class V-fold PLP-dependent enzyme [Ignavibacteriales bacterium]